LEAHFIDEDTAAADGHLKPPALKSPPTITQQDKHVEQGDADRFNAADDGEQVGVSAEATADLVDVLAGRTAGRAAGTTVGTTELTTASEQEVGENSNTSFFDDPLVDAIPRPAKKSTPSRAGLSDEQRLELAAYNLTLREGTFREFFDPTGIKFDHSETVTGFANIDQACDAFRDAFTHDQQEMARNEITKLLYAAPEVTVASVPLDKASAKKRKTTGACAYSAAPTATKPRVRQIIASTMFPVRIPDSTEDHFLTRFLLTKVRWDEVLTYGDRLLEIGCNRSGDGIGCLVTGCKLFTTQWIRWLQSCYNTRMMQSVSDCNTDGLRMGKVGCIIDRRGDERWFWS
jgi:hypothetical protein